MAKRKPASRASNTVLIVDDDKIISGLLQYWLSQRGFEVQTFSDGRVAIDSLATLEPPKLVFLDIMMPFADGFEVLSQMRSKKGWNKVPVIMLTSRASEDSIVRAFEAGANDYVTKPFKPGELMVRMNRLFT